MSAVLTEAPSYSPLRRLKIKDFFKDFSFSEYGGLFSLIRWEQTTSKGSGRQMCPASPCSMRGAIQRAEKGSGFQTVSFEATEAPESGKHH